MHRPNQIRTLLTIAGSDCSGGAGIQADIKTADAFKVYAASAITAVTVQNAMGVKSVNPVCPQIVLDQIDAVYESFTPDAVKIGMLPSADIVRMVSQKLTSLNAVNIVVDPVLLSTTGQSLSGNTNESIRALRDFLFPIASVVTPNYDEARKILGIHENLEPAELCKLFHKSTGAAAVLLKGGHIHGPYCTDILYNGNQFHRYRQVRIDSRNTHGTGCVLSSAIASGLARGLILPQAVRIAKNFISHAIDMAKDIRLTPDNGPLYLFP
ncbi:MAG: bifunctional hydroxymethylpyrimidine kinase/phosphomethylpyrimidine kinase [Bacteroidales bacterium]|nr:bifunctional hydroxymethylpyrimidine kinase/phosphomethylpyrimidine kinase [Bacteroidales bacterium]MDE7464934.1 bifunctional hydroxymethylpyrimidine kinase/phosphomethylpyrimidine kinase [Muribaculaceae bacterium]